MRQSSKEKKRGKEEMKKERERGRVSDEEKNGEKKSS